LSENQVQVIWLNLEDPKPLVSLPADTADARILLTNLGLVMRALRAHYPYLRIVFVSSRIYGGYATTELNPEPYAYETGFSVKWLIESQINEMRGQPANPRAGTLNYATKQAPLILWGPYLWADGPTPRSDGLAWLRQDFEDDGTHPSQGGETKVADRLLDFFKNSPYARCWFVVGGYCL
jgi:lysophospholipase L1-like esterase